MTQRICDFCGTVHGLKTPLVHLSADSMDIHVARSNMAIPLNFSYDARKDTFGLDACMECLMLLVETVRPSDG